MNVFVKKLCPSAILFMSGTGSNAETLLKSDKCGRSWKCKALLTDRPETSGARRLAEAFKLPLIEMDLKKFYASHGLSTTSMLTEKGKKVRELWSEEILKALEPYNPDFLVFAGFFSLCGVASRYTCLNIHPGDLSHEENGKRTYVGLNIVPVERAILAGEKFLRSSVLIVQPFRKDAPVEIDAGLLPGISEPVPVDLEGHSLEELRAVAAARTGKTPDVLSRLAEKNQVLLKISGDLHVLPAVVDCFACGRYARSEAGQLLWKNEDGAWLTVKTVEFTKHGPRPIML